jgi:DegV family protein with EDD domain
VAGDFPTACTAGYERLCAWADLLDDINVFPIADADTGLNLRISLAPLRQIAGHPGNVSEQLVLNARGNSGNIAAAFFSEFLAADETAKLPAAGQAGSRKAWQVLADPRPGTILSFFDALAQVLTEIPADRIPDQMETLVDHLENAVHATRNTLPELEQAGVVDAGALGMFIFFEGFFGSLQGPGYEFRPLTKIFRGKLRRSLSTAAGNGTHCVESIVDFSGSIREATRSLAGVGDSLITIKNREKLKVHLHTNDPQAARGSLQSLGSVLHWRDETAAEHSPPEEHPANACKVHIMTDGAGSVTPADARRRQMTLLSSYISFDGRCLPEILVPADELYKTMREGEKVATSQASDFERRQCYQSALSRYRQVLYLCVGSFYTGNYQAVVSWKKENDPQGRLRVIDTGAASGRLGLIALATAEFAARGRAMEETVRFAEAAVARSREYIFLDRLRYLVAGGRLSKTSGFFGDLLHLKPVITPKKGGVEKAGLTRSPEEQLRFALARLKEERKPRSDSPVMLQYTDNRDWVERAEKEIRRRYPATKIILQPLSLTSGAHMGPGSWGIAFLSDPDRSVEEEEKTP